MAVVFSEGSALLEKHFKEVAHYQDIPLNPDKETYFRCEDADTLRVFTAREIGDLIGYAIFFIKHNMHYKDSKQAVQDVIFIHPEKRGLGLSFINYCDDELREIGVQAVYHHVKRAHNWGPAIEKIGYELVDLIYAKRLDS